MQSCFLRIAYILQEFNCATSIHACNSACFLAVDETVLQQLLAAMWQIKASRTLQVQKVFC